jgi:transcriptional regulator with XRE-family HTH domain
MARTRSAREREFSTGIQKAFGQRLKAARKASNIGQEDLANALGLSRTSISNLEQGRQRVFLDQVYLMAERLQVPLADLLPPPHDVVEEYTIRTPADMPLSARESAVVQRLVRELRGNLSAAASPPDDEVKRAAQRRR